MKVFTMLLFVISMNTFGEGSFEPFFKNNKEIILVGVIQPKGLPHRFTLNSGNLNQEELFISGLTFDESQIYINVKVVVSGKLKLYDKQYMLMKSQIRLAKNSEFDQVKLKEFKYTVIKK